MTLSISRNVSRLFLLAGALFVGGVLLSTPAEACGGRNEAACLGVPACDPFLNARLESCGFLCAELICRDVNCGGPGERICVPFVDHASSQTCRSGLFDHVGSCWEPDRDGFPTWCGDHEEDACDIAIQLDLGIDACKPGHVEEFGLPFGTCYRIDDGTEPPTGCAPGYDAAACHLDTMSLALEAALPEDLPSKLRKKFRKRIDKATFKLEQAQEREELKREDRSLRAVERQLARIERKVLKDTQKETRKIASELAEVLLRESGGCGGEVAALRASLVPITTLSVEATLD